jgi:hypothetical protein
MRHANTPSGPGKLTSARRDAATQAEELDELMGETSGGQDGEPSDSSRDARHAEREAHIRDANRATVGHPGLSHGSGKR